MGKYMKRLAVCVLAAGVMTAPFDAAAEEADSGEEARIVIYHTNDVHGSLEGEDEGSIGLAVVAGLKSEDPDAILVDAGDATQGMPVASLTKGNDVIRLMNLAGYDLMSAGNHEFDFGTEAFLANAELAEFPILAANIYDADGGLLMEGVQDGNEGCHTVVERDGITVGFFGLTTAQTATATNPAGIEGLTFADEAETAKQEISHLKEEGAEVVIAVAHLGDETAGAPYTSAGLAEAMTGEYAGELDVIIDGHSHTVENDIVNDVLIVQTGSNLNAVGKLTVSVESDGSVHAQEELLDAEALSEAEPDSEVSAGLAEIQDFQNEMLSEKIGRTDTTLWAGSIGDLAPTRFVETNYGDLAADAYAQAGRAMLETVGTEEEKKLPVIAAENGGGIREAIRNGDITLGGLTTTFPFSNTLYMKLVTPSVLYEVMELSGSCLEGQDKETGMLLQTEVFGGFLQISGFKVVFDPAAETGNKVVSITLDGQDEPLERTDTTTQIMMVSNNYIMEGGNDYTMLADIPKYAEAGGELETIRSYIEEHLENGVLTGYAGTQGRISYSGGDYEPSGYTAVIRIIDEDGEVCAGQEVRYRVDGGKEQTGTTDEDGILKVPLSDGGHGIRVSDGESENEVYADNYAGIGLVEDEYRTIPELTVSVGEAAKQDESEEAGVQTESGGTDGENNILAGVLLLLAAAAVITALAKYKK